MATFRGIIVEPELGRLNAAAWEALIKEVKAELADGNLDHLFHVLRLSFGPTVRGIRSGHMEKAGRPP